MAERNSGTWVEDLVEYFRELGGAAHYSDLYRYIEANPRRRLGREWQAVVLRTIEEHSSDTTVWGKRRLPDLFRSVDGIGKGNWALREQERATDFPLKAGDKIKRTELHTQFGGSRQGGMTASSRTPNILLFTDPETGLQHGYVDEWKDDGCFHYTGMGQTGDQRMIAGNLATLEHKKNNRILRLFLGSRFTVTYAGPFEVDEGQPFYWDYAPETGGGPKRWVIVFRLRPVGVVIPDSRMLQAPTAPPEVTTIPLEKQHIVSVVVTPNTATIVALRLEASLVIDFADYAEGKELLVERNRIAIGGGAGPFLTDAYVEDMNLLIEAKGACERGAFRMAIGQLADYRRFFKKPICAILVPTRPNDDLFALAKEEGIEVIWRSSSGFESTIERLR